MTEIALGPFDMKRDLAEIVATSVKIVAIADEIGAIIFAFAPIAVVLPLISTKVLSPGDLLPPFTATFTV